MSKNSSKINHDIRKMLIISIVASIAFVVGIPMIVLGATNSTVLMIFGIVFVVFGFYGTPMLWMSYAGLRSLKRVVDAVMEENLTTNAEIAMQLQTSERNIKAQITKAINKKYITGFIYNGEVLTPNEKQQPKKKIIENRCKNCGGTLEELDTEWRCPYCGSRFSKE